MSNGVANEKPSEIVDFAQQLWSRYSATAPRNQRRVMGQYGTPKGVAVLMAERICASVTSSEVRALDPAAGTGILAAALIEQLVRVGVKKIEFDLFEIDPALVPFLSKLIVFSTEYCIQRNVSLSVSINNTDFLLWRESVGEVGLSLYDVVISNPPYFKLRRSDRRATPWLAAIDAQPNIYGLFMLATLGLLSKNSIWCFLTPQSWMSGSYFSLLRRHVTTALRIRGFHFIEDRTGVFGGRGHVRQDVVITWGVPDASPDYAVEVSSSGAADTNFSIRTVALSEVLLGEDGRLVKPEGSSSIVPIRLDRRLSDLGVVIRTGAVVPFRCRWALKDSVDEIGDVPLLWLKHVRHQHVVWPANVKNEVLVVDSRTERYLVEDRGAVLVRRFGPTDSNKRVVAAPIVPDSFGTPFAVENHVNVIMRADGVLDFDECVGLAAFLSSSWVDAYLKRSAGSTQINAGDLRTLPVPSEKGLRSIAVGMRSPKFRTVDDLMARLFL